jgi:hypothetical protein
MFIKRNIVAKLRIKIYKFQLVRAWCFSLQVNSLRFESDFQLIASGEIKTQAFLIYACKLKILLSSWIIVAVLLKRSCGSSCKVSPF